MIALLIDDRWDTTGPRCGAEQDLEGLLEPPVTVTGSTLSGNSASGFYGGGTGGGIYNSGTMTVTDSTLSGNSVGFSSSTGGGISNSGTMTVTNSTLSGNSASGFTTFVWGGGI